MTKLSAMASKINCKLEALPFVYLGLSLGGHPKNAYLWQPIQDEVHKKLDHWKRFHLSRGGRLALCKLVLSHLPTYYMSYLSNAFSCWIGAGNVYYITSFGKEIMEVRFLILCTGKQ